MRYLPLTDVDRQKMLATIGVANIDELFSDIPKAARLADGLSDLPDHAPEQSVERHFTQMSAQNISAGSVPFFCGAGAYRHHVPASVDHLIQRSEFLTAYTPYQPEIAQGTLQTLFEFQTQVAQITGMGVANASMYDGSTACAEAVLMAARITKRKKCILASGLHPHYGQTARTATHTFDIEIEQGGAGIGLEHKIIDQIDDETACIVVQTPNVFGEVIDLEPFAAAAHEKGALLIAVTTEIVSLGLLKNPGEMGADIVAAEGQSIGNALNYGGPYVGLFACRNDRKFIRQAPGRFAGQTVDANGDRGFVLTLSTREQHIRREKATSNICTNSGLCSLAFTIHLSLLGDKGFRHLARLNHQKACELADRLSAISGVELLTPKFFNEFTLRLSKSANEVVENLAAKGILGGIPASRLYGAGKMENLLLVTATETNTNQDMDQFAQALAGELS